MQIGISKATLIGYLKQILLKKISVNMKLALMTKHIKASMKWCEGFVSTYDGHYHNMMDYPHLDDNCFYLVHVKNYFYMLPEEAVPHFMCQNKNFLLKIMFVSSVTFHRYDKDKMSVSIEKLAAGHLSSTSMPITKEQTCRYT